MCIRHAVGNGWNLDEFRGHRAGGFGERVSNRSIKRSILPKAWRGSAAVVLLLLAIGATLRFFRLGARELSIDESLSWAESAGQSMADVLRVQHRLDSGKFPIYELAQHQWIRVFGDSETALRALPALIGSLSIILVFILAVEVMFAAYGTRESSPGAQHQREPMSHDAGVNAVSAICALLFAVALPSVEIARQARMYSMMLAWILLQMIFLFRARRRGGLANYAGLTIFSALAVATNFTTVLVIAAEALWIVYLRLATTQTQQEPAGATPPLIGAALIAAMLLLLPFYAGLRYGVAGIGRGDYDWIRPPGRFEPFATFESALGSWTFPLFAVFAIAGGIRLWRSHRDEAVLLILWVGLPPIVLWAGSYLVTPMLVTRYMISSFVPLFVLTAIGIESLPARNYRAVAIIAIASFSIMRVSWDFRPGETNWRDACAIALTEAGPEHRVGAFHGYYLVSYYVHSAQREGVRVVRVPVHAREGEAPRVVIVSLTAAPTQVAEISREYPTLVGNFKNVRVMSRADAASRPPAAR